MKKPGLAVDEDERLSILDELGIIYSPAEERFDRITRLTKRIFNVPMALVSLVTANTQWFKSSQGLLESETTREVSFCGHAILGDDTFVVADTHKNPDFSDNPLVINEPFIRFYAGHPVRVNSVKIGTLCIIDQRPRRFSSADFDTLKSLALWVENEVKLSLYTASQKELLQKIRNLDRKVVIDNITGCWNSRGVEKLLYQELERAQRDNKPVSLLMVDVEQIVQGWRKVSGKSTGMILKEVAQIIRRSVRGHDIVGLMENYRFLVYLSNCEKEMCRILSQRILRNISGQRIKLNKDYIYLSATVGMTSNEGTNIWSSTRLLDTVEKASEIATQTGPNKTHFLRPEIDEHKQT